MLSTHRIFSLGMVRRTVSRSIITSAEIEKYKTDTATLARWLDVSIVKEKGRAFDADRYLIKKKEADYFPPVKVFNLNGKNILIPDQIEGKAKLVVFSFKHYGFTLVRSWINPYIERFNSSTKSLSSNENNGDEGEMQDVSSQISTSAVQSGGAVAFEVCFVEYGFLSMAKTMFASNIKANVNPMQVDNTGLVFGGVKVRSVLYERCVCLLCKLIYTSAYSTKMYMLYSYAYQPFN